MKISVAMTTYNGARFLREQLESIFIQTRLPDEIVVCDDDSSDCTRELLQEFADRSPCPMKVIINNETLGSTKNFEKAIGLCTGDLIALSDQDDVWRRQKLAVIETAFLADPNLGVVLTDADLINQDGKRLRGSLWSRCRFNTKRQQILGTAQRYDLLFGLPVATGATMVFRSSFKPILLPFPAGAPTFIHDRWIAVLISAVARIRVLDEKLIEYRLHPRQQLGVGLPLPLKVFVPHQCSSDVIALSALNERLSGTASFSTSSEFWTSLAERRQHVAVRVSYSRNLLLRLKQVARELQSGRYQRYPFGLIFCAKDVVVGTR